MDCEITVGCRKSTMQRAAQFVRATSDGTWTTHLPGDGKVKEIPLGLPALRPVWKKSPFNGEHELLQVRTKREIPDQDETWQDPSGGEKFGWALESFFSPVANCPNREMLDKLEVNRQSSTSHPGRI